MAVRSKGRRLAFDILKVFDAEKMPLSVLMGKSLISPIDGRKMPAALVDERELSLSYELIMGVMRWQKKIDHILSLYSKKSVDSLDAHVRTALRMGIYQIFFLDRIPPHAAIDESVELAKKDSGLSGASFVNGVLREISRNPGRIRFPERDQDAVTWLSIHHSHPEWLVSRWVKRFGEGETESLLQANNRQPPMSLWINRNLFSEESVLRDLQKEGMSVTPSKYLDGACSIQGGLPHRTGIFKKGGFYIQDEASQLIPFIFGRLSGKIADLCAAPGGKGLRMAHAMGKEGFVVGVDSSFSRIHSLVENKERMKITNIYPVVADVEECLPLKEEFDFVLLDAPCSGTGVIRRNPDIKWKLQEEDIVRHSSRQLRLLQEARKIVRKGGLLLYSVCSIEEEETEGVVSLFLKRNPDFKLEDPLTRIPERARELIFSGTFFRTFPHRDNLDGFFAALFRKRA